MVETEIKHLHEDIELIKKDIAVIKHILSEEGELTDEAKRRLEVARKMPDSKYIDL